MHDFYHELQHVCLRLAKRGRGRRRVERGGAAGTGWRNRRRNGNAGEIVSVLKNMTLCGLPVPAKIKRWVQKFLEDMTEELPEENRTGNA